MNKLSELKVLLFKKLKLTQSFLMRKKRKNFSIVGYIKYLWRNYEK